MGSLRSLVTVEGDPAIDCSLGLYAFFLSLQIDTFILQGPPQALDEDVVYAAPLAVHRDPVPACFSRSIQAKEVNAPWTPHGLSRSEAGRVDFWRRMMLP